MDAVDPVIDILPAREIAATPLFLLGHPLLLEANNHVGAAPLGPLAQKFFQGLGETSRGDP